MGRSRVGQGMLFDIFEHDVSFESISLMVTSFGLTLSGRITINGHTSTSGTISFSRDGVQIRGQIGDLPFEDVLVKNAKFDVFIASKLDTGCARSSRCAILGSVRLAGVELDVAVSTEKTPSKLLWTVYGEMRGSVTTSNLVEELKGTFLDVTLDRLTLIATNRDEPHNSHSGLSYPVSKGVQFCALVDRIPQLEQLLGGSVKGMVFRAVLDVDPKKLHIGIILPAERTITFSDTVYTGPLELAFEFGANPTDILIMLRACLNMKLDTHPEPLAFDLGLKAGVTSATAYAQMLTDWINPCGLGNDIVIRKCTLEIGIVYSTFLVTGPGEIGLAGELAVGSKNVQAAMKMSQNPKEQLLVAEIHDLGTTDLVAFASFVIGQELPDPGEILHFNELSLYLSTGTRIGLTEYPAGVSAKGDMRIFGKRAKFDLSVGSAVKIMATIEQFELGPLKVRGATGPDPVVDIELFAAKQSILIDGAVEIWDLLTVVHLDAQLYPEPKLDFWVHLQLSNLLLVKLEAKLSGVVDIKRPESFANADFEVRAVVEQHIVDEVVKQLSQQIQVAKDDAKRGFDEMKAVMDMMEAEYQAICQAAIDLLEEKRKDWHAKKAAVDAAFNGAHTVATRIREDVERTVDEAERSFKVVVATATAALEQTRHDASAAIAEAERDVENAQRDSDNIIRDAQADLQRARDNLHNSFGNAQRDLENARRAVEDAQRTINELDRLINELDRRINDEPWFLCPPLVAEKARLCVAQGGATVGLQMARGCFLVAEGIVQGGDFIVAEGAISTAEVALESARVVKAEALDIARGTLSAVRQEQEGLIRAAIDSLKTAQEACEELHMFERTKDALHSGEVVCQGIMSGAQTTVDKLADCIEFLEFDLAEKALKFAQDNTSELNLARHALQVAEGAVNIGLKIGEWAVSEAGEIFNIRKMEFSGSVRSLTSKDGPPLGVSIEGIVFGKNVAFHLVWKPQFNLVEFIKELFTLLWQKIQEIAKTLLTR